MKRAPSTLAAALALIAGLPAAHAGAPRTAVIGMGDCRDAELVDSARSLSRNLAQQRGMSVVGEAELLEQIGRRPSKTMEELQRQVETAQEQFYQARYTRAIKHLDGALQEIARLPPGAKRWQLEVSARLLEGLIRARLQGDASVIEPFSRVLRLDSGYKLDTDYFGPSTIERFEKIRRQLARAPRAALDVTSHPAGADVFLDGRAVGKTPYRGNLPEGSYQLLVGKDGALSLQREVRVPVGSAIHVDLQFEGTVHRHRTLCLAEAREDRARLKNAVKLASILDLDRLVLLRIERPSQGTNWISATLLNVSEGQKIREGGLQFEEYGVSDVGLAELARFVATGEHTPRVILPPTDDQPLSPTATARTPGASPPGIDLPATAVPLVVNTAATGATAWTTPPLQPFGRHSATFALGVGSAAAAATGVAFLVSASESHTRLQTLMANRIIGSEAPAARDLIDEFALRRNLGFVGLGVGVGALTGGIVLYLLDHRPPEQQSPRLLAAPTPDGFAMSLGGGF
jgi:hypothetical protein